MKEVSVVTDCYVRDRNDLTYNLMILQRGGVGTAMLLVSLCLDIQMLCYMEQPCRLTYKCTRRWCLRLQPKYISSSLPWYPCTYLLK